jgi:hypothetical protein
MALTVARLLPARAPARCWRCTWSRTQIVLTSYEHGVPFSVPGAEYPLYVPNIDRNGNAVAGIRVPEVSVPLASYEGWNLRAAGHAIDEGCISTGSAIPLATNRQEEAAGTDTRAALADLYTGRADYQAKVAARPRRWCARGICCPKTLRPTSSLRPPACPRT